MARNGGGEMKRTLKNCSLIKKIGGPPNKYDGKCEGLRKRKVSE